MYLLAGASNARRLYRYQTAARTVTLIGGTLTQSLVDIDYDRSTAKLYGVTSGGAVYEIETTNATLTAVTATGFPSGYVARGLAALDGNLTVVVDRYYAAVPGTPSTPPGRRWSTT